MKKDKYIQPGFDEFGRQIPDPNPVEVPLKFRNAETKEEMITRLIRHELSRAAEQKGMETLAESDDFDVEDIEDPDPMSQYELRDIQEEYPILPVSESSHPDSYASGTDGVTNDNEDKNKKSSADKNPLDSQDDGES